MIENSESKSNTYSRAAILATISSAVFLIACILGEGIGGSLGSNPSCYKYLGCTSGFIGYDAMEHFLFGIAAIWALVFLFQRFPQYSMLNTKHWKNILILIATVSLISVAWEFLECAHDIFRVDVLNQQLFNLKLDINLLDQPTNLDTMGDLAFGFFGALISLFFIEKKPA